MNSMKELYSVLARTVSLLPWLLVLALTGCGVAYAFGVALDQAAVAVSVPIVVVFVLGRLLSLLVAQADENATREHQVQHSNIKVSGVLIGLGLGFFCFVLVCGDFLISAFIYWGLQLRELFQGALKISAISAFAATGCATLIALCIVHEVVGEWSPLITRGLLRILGYPRRVAQTVAHGFMSIHN